MYDLSIQSTYTLNPQTTKAHLSIRASGATPRADLRYTPAAAIWSRRGQGGQKLGNETEETRRSDSPVLLGSATPKTRAPR
ncbi:hypothetical protein PZA11_007073 [Diplocarpon coronariae]